MFFAKLHECLTGMELTPNPRVQANTSNPIKVAHILYPATEGLKLRNQAIAAINSFVTGEKARQDMTKGATALKLTLKPGLSKIRASLPSEPPRPPAPPSPKSLPMPQAGITYGSTPM